MEEKLQASLVSAIRRMTTTLRRAEGHVRAGEAHVAMVFLAALEKDAKGSAEALAHAFGALADLQETRGMLKYPTETGTEGGAVPDIPTIRTSPRAEGPVKILACGPPREDDVQLRYESYGWNSR